MMDAFLIHLGPSIGTECPQRPRCEDELPPLDVDHFFSAKYAIEIDYDGMFRAHCLVNRSWGTVQTSAS